MPYGGKIAECLMVGRGHVASAQDSYLQLTRSNENNQYLLVVYVDHVVTHFKLYSLLFFNQMLVV